MGIRHLAFGALCLLAFASPTGHAFCVENAVQGRVAQVTLTPIQPRPPRVYTDETGFDKQSCCNPRNAECNPDKVPEDALLFFRARLDGADPRTRPLVCTVVDSRQVAVPTVYAPVRGFLRFESNPQFNPRGPAVANNAPVLARVLDPERRQVTAFPCF